MSTRFRVVFSGVCAVLVALLCATYARHVRGEADRVRQESIERYGGEVVSLVVAMGTLEAGDVVGYGDVAQRDWLVDLAPDGALTSIDEAIGQRVSAPVAAGAPLTQLALRSASGVATVPEGMVAVSLPLTDRLGLSRGVQAGSRLVALRVRDGSSQVISGNVQVVAAPEESSVLGASAQVTVAAGPDEVARMLEASASGDLRLALPADDVTVLPTSNPAAPTEVPAVEVAAEQDGAEAEEATPGEASDAGAEPDESAYEDEDGLVDIEAEEDQ